ncbi:MAG TPA: ABC-type transport auxiliary lipoprotein family protein [Sulfuricella sp.]|nr:ABC-type transport auxiliary lipoprotein family protein [Sulfuricella sp.]
MWHFRGKKYGSKTISPVLILVLAGCASFRPVETEFQHTYLIEAQPSQAEHVRPIPLTLSISPIRAMPGYDTSRMAFVRQPHVLEYFARNRWVDSPAKMIAPLLERALERQSGFRAVTSAAETSRGDIRLDMELVLLRQEFMSSPSRLHLKLRVQLVEQANHRVLATKEFEAFENAPSDDPYGGVLAANSALPGLLGQISDFSAYYGTLLSNPPK